MNFLDNRDVPSNAVECWDVSSLHDGGVIAYVTLNDDDKYDLFIGASGGVIANENSNYLFKGFVSLEEINFNDNFDTSRVLSMKEMFSDVLSLTTLDLSSFDTRSVIDMARMFWVSASASDSKLETIIFGDNFDTGSVTDMTWFFANCNSLANIDVSGFDTSNVTSMRQLFFRCKDIKSLDLSNWNTSKVTDMYQMFSQCSNLTELNLCSFDTSSVTDIFAIFAYNNNLTKVLVGPKWVATSSNMFYDAGVSSVTTGQCT